MEAKAAVDKQSGAIEARVFQLCTWFTLSSIHPSICSSAALNWLNIGDWSVQQSKVHVLYLSGSFAYRLSLKNKWLFEVLS